MPLIEDFDLAASLAIEGRPAPVSKKPQRNRPAPFSIRLSNDERARLAAEAAGAPLGAYIKAKVLGTSLPIRVRRTGLAVEDRTALAKTLALLGQSRISNNLNQLAHLGNVGALPITPETEGELRATLEEVRDMRHLLLAALGLKPEDAP
jgi:hypothetical protein